MLDLTLNSSIYTNNIWEAALQELDILFNTTNTELLGYPDFGTNFYHFLWSLTPMNNELQKYVDKKLAATSFVKQLRCHAKVESIIDEVNSEIIYRVKINLYNDFQSVEKTYTLNELTS